MKLLIVIVIQFIFNSNLQAQNNVSATQFMQAFGGVEAFNSTMRNYNNYRHFHPEISYMGTETVSTNEKSCINCPEYFPLISNVNKILEKLVKDPHYVDSNLPLEVGKLKLVSSYVRKKSEDGSVRCMDSGPFLEMQKSDSRLDGQAKLITEQVFNIENAEQVYLQNPEIDQKVFYFKSPNDKSVLVQVVEEKNLPLKIRYFKYTPKDESNPYHLPDLGDAPSGFGLGKIEIKKVVPKNDLIPTTEELSRRFKDGAIFDLNMDNKLVTKDSSPRDFQFGHANIETLLTSDALLTGGAKVTLLQGNVIDLKVKSTATMNDMLIVNLQTKPNGKTERTIVIPMYLSLTADGNTGIKSAIQDDSKGKSISLSLANNKLDLVRGLIRQSSDNKKVAVIFGRDFNVSEKDKLTVEGGKDDTAANFVALRGSKKISNGTSVAVDVKINNQKQTTFYWTLLSRF